VGLRGMRLPEPDSRRTALAHRSRAAEEGRRTARGRLGFGMVADRRNLVLERQYGAGSLVGAGSRRRSSRQTC
jgi:hypothetical protein